MSFSFLVYIGAVGCPFLVEVQGIFFFYLLVVGILYTGFTMSFWETSVTGSSSLGVPGVGKSSEEQGVGGRSSGVVVDEGGLEEDSGTVVTNGDSEGCSCCCFCRARGEMVQREDEREKRLIELVSERVDRSVGELVETVVSRVRESVVSTTKECLEMQKGAQGRVFHELLMDVKDEVVGNLETLGERMEEGLRAREEKMERSTVDSRREKCRYGQPCRKHGRVHRSREELGVR